MSLLIFYSNSFIRKGNIPKIKTVKVRKRLWTARLVHLAQGNLRAFSHRWKLITSWKTTLNFYWSWPVPRASPSLVTASPAPCPSHLAATARCPVLARVGRTQSLFHQCPSRWRDFWFCFAPMTFEMLKAFYWQFLIAEIVLCYFKGKINPLIL